MFETYVSKTCKVAVSFTETYTSIDPRHVWRQRNDNQWVTFATIRPLQGPKETFVGQAVCSPADRPNEAIGRKVALARALRQMLPDLDGRECTRLARQILRTQKLLPAEVEIRAEFAAQEAVNA